MRLPHRTPWASLAELDELCGWVYADPADLAAKTQAVQRLSAWRAITPLPHALDALLALLSATLLDAPGSSSSLALRHAYAAALIRLVNGLVDPLQLGAYARSIGAIAAQLGLPAWLVELRHAATHEDLPSLELLRQAALESLDWLYQNYFTPTLNPSSAPRRALSEPRPLAPLLARYKALAKALARDTTLAAQLAGDVQGVLREVERWIAEAAVGAGGPLGFDGEEGEGEREALGALADGLLARGALVPLSKKKRLAPKGQALPPAELLAIWTPLLEHVMLLHPAFASALTSRAISALLATGQIQEAPADEGEEQSARDSDALTYQHCVASWVAWLARDAGAREEAFIALAHALGPGSERGRLSKATRSLLITLSANDEHLSRISEQILSGNKLDEAAAQLNESQEDWASEDMEVMDGRLSSLRALPTSAPSAGVDADAGHVVQAGDNQLPPGWSKAGASWTPCPIGVYIAAQ